MIIGLSLEQNLFVRAQTATLATFATTLSTSLAFNTKSHINYLSIMISETTRLHWYVQLLTIYFTHFARMVKNKKTYIFLPVNES